MIMFVLQRLLGYDYFRTPENFGTSNDISELREAVCPLFFCNHENLRPPGSRRTDGD